MLLCSTSWGIDVHVSTQWLSSARASRAAENAAAAAEAGAAPAVLPSSSSGSTSDEQSPAMDKGAIMIRWVKRASGVSDESSKSGFGRKQCVVYKTTRKDSRHTKDRQEVLIPLADDGQDVQPPAYVLPHPYSTARRIHRPRYVQRVRVTNGRKIIARSLDPLAVIVRFSLMGIVCILIKVRGK